MAAEECKAPGAVVTNEMVDEFLECLWILEEQGKGTANNRPVLSKMAMDECFVDNMAGAESVLKRMVDEGLVRLGADEVSFEEKGRGLAKVVIRRKRLAEKLLAEVFEVGDGEIKASACRFEHILSPEVTDSVCSFLGHPPICPHGKPIPQGDCCKKLTHHVKPLVIPLRDLSPGEKGRIVFIAPKDHSRMDRLSTLGIVPGTIVSLHQKKPAFVIRTGETELALDIDIAGEIYVKQVG